MQQATDPLMVALVAALAGASASIAGTTATLWWTGRLHAARNEQEWELERSSDRRQVYGRFLSAAALWRDACADLDGDPDHGDWKRYWAARVPAVEAATQLSLIAPTENVENVSEATDELLDIAWDYAVSGPEFLKSALWHKIEYIDSEIEKV